ncbi:MAG: D-alanyl-D-alanine carboxypeptidase [Lachnospiraceae bacterium]|nr:D-alanyl-D-alanine carboxypeptidase [Lachnospiraceae bacterium]
MKVWRVCSIKNGYGYWKRAGIAGRVLLFSLCVALGVQASLRAEAAGEAQPDFSLYAKSAVLMDAESGRVLYEKNGYEHMPNASTTKIMTCILALEQGNLEDEVKVSSYAASMPRVRLGMSTDDTFRLRDLLYSLMLESHNDSAVAIAEHIAGSVEEFAKRMNQKAKELGCKDTYFITPNGLDSQDESGVHGTTAEDLANIMSYCIQNEQFLEITRTASYQFTNVAGTKSYSCNNHNAFLQMMEGALSGKTGFTGNAGYCYVGALEREGRTFVVALLACGWPNNKSYKWADTTALMNYGLEQYQNVDVCEYGKEFAPAAAINAEPENGRLYQEVTVPLEVKEQEIVVLKRDGEEVRAIYDVPKNLQAPIKEGQKVGSVTYYLGERQIAEIPICAGKSVKELEPSWYQEYLMKLFFMKKNFYFL